MKVRDIAARLGPRTKFLIGGALNTAVTYLIYLGLRIVIDYQWAFLAAYLLGIAMAYLFNAIVVFRSRLHWKNAVSFPLVYMIQYGVSAATLGLLVEVVTLDERIAPLLVTIAMLPLTYVLAKLVFKATSKEQ